MDLAAKHLIRPLANRVRSVPANGPDNLSDHSRADTYRTLIRRDTLLRKQVSGSSHTRGENPITDVRSFHLRGYLWILR